MVRIEGVLILRSDLVPGAVIIYLWKIYRAFKAKLALRKNASVKYMYIHFSAVSQCYITYFFLISS